MYAIYKCLNCHARNFIKTESSTHRLKLQCRGRRCENAPPMQFHTTVQHKPKRGIERTATRDQQPRRSTRKVVNYAGAQSETELENDGDYLIPSRSFHLGMRYTVNSYHARTPAPVFPVIKSTRYTSIGDPKGRGSETNAVMGRAIHGSAVRLSAHDHSKRGVPYRIDAQRSEEWCHLIADSLGGPTVEPNLVAASYSANTFMAVIESCIKGNGLIDVKVDAHGGSPHIAETIAYKLRLKSNHQTKLVFNIDAACQGFSEADAQKLRRELNQWLRDNRARAKNV